MPSGFRTRPTGSSGEELDYAEITAPVGPVAVSEGTANAVITGNAITCDGGPLIVEFSAPSWRADSGGAGRTCQLVLLMDGAVIDGNLAKIVAAAATAGDEPIFVRRRVTPAPGSHTFSVKAFVSAGTGNIDAGVGGSGNSVAAFLRVTRA